MKLNRITKILVVVLAVTMLPLWLFGCGSKVSDNTVSALTETLIGSGKLSKKNEASKAYLEQLDKDAEDLKVNFQKAGWNSGTYLAGEEYSVGHYRNTYKLALAWGTKGSAYYHDGAVLEMIKTALDFGYTDIFGANLITSNGTTTAETREKCSIYLLRTVLIVKSKLKADAVEDYLSIIDLKFPAPIGDGMDLIRTSYIAVANNAIKGDNESVEKFSGVFLDDIISIVNSGDGRYSDGSFIWKLNVNTLEEGVEAADLLADLCYAFAGTSCDLGTAATDALYNWVVDSIRYSLYNGTAVSPSLSHSISEGDRMGGEAVGTMLKIAAICGGEQGNAINSLVKSYTGTEFKKYMGSYATELYEKVASNKKIEASSEALGAHSYASADYLTVLGSKFSLSLAMSSTRTNKYKTSEYAADTNTELYGGYNGDMWYTREGMLTLYTTDYKLPSDYLTTVNTYRLPGTTVDNRERDDSHTVSYNGITPFAGSAVLGSSAVSAMIATGNNSEYLSDLSAKKSWFVFGDKIVCLGAGISNTTTPNSLKDYGIETVIENIYFGSYTTVNTSLEDDGTPISDNPTKLTSGSALYFTKYGLIYIPTSNTSDAYMRLNKNGKTNFVELWFDHGATPNGASYEYAIYPSTTGKSGALYDKVANGGDYTVLSNTADVQAVKDSSGQVGYTFWNGATCNGVTTDFACNMLVSETDSRITIAISDISHNSYSNAGGTITLEGNYSLSSADNGLSFSGNTITVDRSVAANGQTLVIVLSK